FADAGAVQPNKRSKRPRLARLSVAFGKALCIFLATAEPPAQKTRRQCRHRRQRGEPIESQRERQLIAHAHSSPCDRAAASKSRIAAFCRPHTLWHSLDTDGAPPA